MRTASFREGNGLKKHTFFKGFTAVRGSCPFCGKKTPLRAWILCQARSLKEWYSRWWFQIFVIFTPTWGRDPNWRRFFNWVETTNQYLVQRIPFCFFHGYFFRSPMRVQHVEPEKLRGATSARKHMYEQLPPQKNCHLWCWSYLFQSTAMFLYLEYTRWVPNSYDGVTTPINGLKDGKLGWENPTYRRYAIPFTNGL